MIKFEDGILSMNDDSCYDLNKSSKERVMQGLNAQLLDGSLTSEEYAQCMVFMRGVKQTIEMTINVFNREYVEEKVAKFNKVASRLNKALITLAFSNERQEEKIVKFEGEEVVEVVEVIDLTIEITEELKIGEYEIVAMIDHTYPTKNFVKAYKPLDKDYIERLEKVGCICQHCNSKRKRNATYIVNSLKDGSSLQVGKSCLKDYVGHDVLMALNYFDLLEELQKNIREYNGNTPREQTFLKVNEVLAMIERNINVNGYIRTDNGISTGKQTHMQVSDIYSNIDERKRHLPTTDKEFKEEIELIANHETENGWMLSLKNVLRHKYCKMKDVFLLATFFVCVDIIKKEHDKDKEKVISQHVGNVGDKVEMELTLFHRFGFDTQYGYMIILLFKDAQGNVFKWGTKSDLKIEIGDTKTYKFTIKSHEEYKEEKQTCILRVKEI